MSSKDIHWVCIPQEGTNHGGILKYKYCPSCVAYVPESNFKKVRDALLGLKRSSTCFCEVAIGNPMMRDHSLSCKAATLALEET